MGAACKAVASIDTEVLRVDVIEQKGEEVRKALHALEDYEKQGDEACAKLRGHTTAMELEKRRKHAEKVELEKNIVQWHLAQSEESEEHTRYWLQGALNKAEEVMQLQSDELATLRAQYTADTTTLKNEIEALKEQAQCEARKNTTMSEEMATNWRHLREELSESKFEREKLEAREYKAASELRLTQEDLEATKNRLESAREQINEAERLQAAAVEDATKARRELQERLEYSNELRLARCEDVQTDRVQGETRLRMELQTLQVTNQRLQQEKVEVSARLQLAEQESAHVMRSLLQEQDAHAATRETVESLRNKLAKEEAVSARLRKELSVASDDVINLQHEHNTVLRVQAALRKENRELGALNVQAVDYRTYQPPYQLNNDSNKAAWAARKDELLNK